MNVLLVITNINGFHEVPYSFGLSSIASYIVKKGYNVKVLSISQKEQYEWFVKEAIAFQPVVIGFTSVSSQFTYVKQIAQLVKEADKNIIIVCGGVHPTLYPEAVAESAAIDGLFLGESEIAFGEFLDKIRDRGDYRSTHNFAYREGDEIIKNPLHPLVENLDVLPYPQKNFLFEEFIKKNGYAPFFFSRGCPYACSYCSNHVLAKIYGMSRNRTRYRSVDSCIEEIKDALRQYEFKSIWILDDTFGLDKKWRKEFCERYKKDVGLKFICLLRVNIVDKDFVKALKEAGCYRIQFGVESGNEYIRNTVMNRNISDEQIVTAFDLCHKYGIESNAFNIIGIPGETDEMIWDTINLNRKINPTDSGINIFYPYKGTVLGDYCFSNDLVNLDLYNDFSNERRDSVLKYTEEFKEKLRYYHQNWERLVYPKNLRKILLSILRKYKGLYSILRKIKRAVT